MSRKQQLYIKADMIYIIVALTISRAASLPLLCSVDVCSSGRIKSSAVVGSPGYRDTSS